MPAQYHQLFKDAERQQLMADALQQGAMTPRQHQQGRIVANTGGADAVASLAQAMMARRTQKKATATSAQAEDARRQAQAAALAGMSGQQDASQGPPAPVNPYAQGQSALDAGIDPALVKSYMAQQFPDLQQGAESATMQGYRQAKAEGYQGSWMDYQKEFHGREANTPAVLQEWEKFAAMSPEQQRAYIEMKRALPIENIGEVPTQVGPGGELNPLSSLDNEAAAAGQIKDSEGEAAARSAARVKVETEVPGDIAALDEQIRKTTEVLNRFKRDDFQTGPIAGLLPAVTTAGQDLESYMGEDIIQRISQATFGALSEGERDFLRRSGMNRGNTEAANMNILERRLTSLQNLKRIAQERLARVQRSQPERVDDIPTIQLPNAAPPDDPLGLR